MRLGIGWEVNRHFIFSMHRSIVCSMRSRLLSILALFPLRMVGNPGTEISTRSFVSSSKYSLVARMVPIAWFSSLRKSLIFYLLRNSSNADIDSSGGKKFGPFKYLEPSSAHNGSPFGSNFDS